MKLNPDCIRDILLYVEEESSPRGFVGIDERSYKNYGLLKKYEYDVLDYHVTVCNDNGFFVDYIQFMKYEHGMRDLSPEGRKFLDNIRSESIWNKIKDKISKLGSVSLNTLIQIAASVATDVISQNLTI